MNIQTIIAVVILAVVLFLAIRYIYREKKKGVHCIGCPMAGSCTKAYAEMEREMKTCLQQKLAEQNSEQ